MSEIINPAFKDIKQEFERGFAGMTTEDVSCRELEQSREQLVQLIRSSFQDADRQFLLSVKQATPDWSLLSVEGIEKLPAVRWKLRNLESMDRAKRTLLYQQLEMVLVTESDSTGPSRRESGNP